MPISANVSAPAFRPTVTLEADDSTSTEDLRTALLDANIPALLAALVHMTGDHTWLRAPYAPTRTRGLADNTDGGLAPAVQDEIRAAALQTFSEWDGRVRELPDAELAEIMSVCMGEPVGTDYCGMMAEEMGLRPRYANNRIATLPGRTDYSVTIVGAGVSGICMAVQLKQAGIPFTVLEKNDDLGGTWWENRYPDCGVDTPSYWYSYSFHPVNWSHYYSGHADVHAYLSDTVDRFDLRRHIRFSTQATHAEYDEATAMWSIATTGLDDRTGIERSRFLVTAVGQLNEPKIPTIPGQDTFAHDQFHSARWPEHLDLAGRRVAVVGTGASAMQLVPAISDQVATLTVFQRSPQWIAPNAEYSREVSPGTRYLMAHMPFYAAWYRMRQVWVFGDKVFESLVVDPEWPDPASSVNSVNDGHRRHFTDYVRRRLADRPDLVAKSVPDYPPFGKRMLLDNGWFRTLREQHVTLETSPVASIGTGSVRTADGTEHEADVIVYATGFDSLNLLGSVEIRGRGGVRLRDRWGADDARAYLGMTERGFPNMFMLYGPNTNLGHGGSLIFITECHVRYLMGVIEQMIEAGATSVECREDLRDAYNRDVDAAHDGLIWTHPGMSTWYRNSDGRVVTNSPWRLVDLWHQTAAPTLDDYEIGGAGSPRPPA